MSLLKALVGPNDTIDFSRTKSSHYKQRATSAALESSFFRCETPRATVATFAREPPLETPKC